MAWVSLLDQQVSWLVLFFGEWQNLGQCDWGTWGRFLAEMSGGVTGTVRVTDDSVWTLAGLNSHLLSAVMKDMSAGAVLPETIHKVSGHYSAEQRGLEWVSQVRNRRKESQQIKKPN